MCPIFDFSCPYCEKTEELYCKGAWEVVQCSCGGEMRTLPPKIGFVVHGANEKNGYTIKKESC